ncbi:MAG: transcriptional regulator [Acidobacteriaceae bacterium]|nr:transcriptional regulator [Acidobacteriaceae bacterium]
MEKVLEKVENRPGRPRCLDARRAILEATWEILGGAGGFADLTMEGIAERAGVGKTTVYRWWPNKASVAAEAFFTRIEPKVRFPDTGSLREDIRLQMKELCKVLTSRNGRVLRALLGGGQSDPELIEAFRSQWMEPRRVKGREILSKAVRSGEMRPDIDLDLALDALYGPIYLRFHVKHLPLDDLFVDQLCDSVFEGLLAKTSARPRSRAH